MPLSLADVVGLLERRYPPATAEGWDAVGLVAGDPGDPVSKVMLAVDPTEEVAEEALAWGADLLVTHHPLYLRGTSSVAATTPKGRVVHRLLAGGCALYAAHTNADAAADGVAEALADAVGLGETRPIQPLAGGALDTLVVFVPRSDTQRLLDALAEAGAGRLGEYERAAFTSPGTGTFRPLDSARPAIGQVGQVEEVAEDRLEIVLPRERRAAVLAALRAAHPYEQPAYTLVAQATEEAATGTGRIGDLPAPMTLRDFAQRVAAVLPATPQGIRVGGDLDAEVRTVAVCGGAGDSLLAQVRRLGADVYLTADLRHHPASEHLAGGRPYLVDATHWASEWPWLPRAADRLRADAAARGTRLDLRVSTRVTDPWTLHLPQQHSEHTHEGARP
ncbi:Nif3-like dinuclear metal center hexameric protein [Georgenia thermotolerans]|uniref:GTP cyclohydrolase 1 type 2 homolog n=1 Tax=Georgenia thermotolerans TaxID=527326 RepID=A0A7J5US90_9MICO|nr:Nif3-like dinuclear metal center hexameric protein [Georgenia thermotolerans]KAE8765130.1 Nif3-like dinuclear metal center hexameric protein [Georgenia thermotolerans]